jgi:hypothetical protein
MLASLGNNSSKIVKFHLPKPLIQLIVNKIAISPTRFLKTVNMPDLADFSFW